MDKKVDVLVKKKDVISVLQNMIREIQMNDYGTDSGIKELYEAINQIDKLKGVEAWSRIHQEV